MIELSTPKTQPDFCFERDSLAFSNELLWVYSEEPTTGRTQFTRRLPKPLYVHRCFVLCRVARQFYLHAEFNPKGEQLQKEEYRHLISRVLSRSPREASSLNTKVHVPGYRGLRDFSSAHEALMKSECGGAWRSYCLRSHWRMVFPITRDHQRRTAFQLMSTVASTGSAVVHLVTFPKLSINHGMLLYSTTVQPDQIVFAAYDPNNHRAPTSLVYKIHSRSFHLGANTYWQGGELNVIQIYQSWLF